jgi:hypothetical protein
VAEDDTGEDPEELIHDDVAGRHCADECAGEQRQQNGSFRETCSQAAQDDDDQDDRQGDQTENASLDEHLHQEVVRVLVELLLVVHQFRRQVVVQVSPPDAELVRPGNVQRVLQKRDPTGVRRRGDA